MRRTALRGRSTGAAAGRATKERILARAKAEGRKLRQDEKAKLHGPKLLLAKNFSDMSVDPTGWWASEKLDGVRAYWDGKRFISRQGNVFSAPEFFTKGLPKDATLDGELWMGRRKFQDTLSVVKRQGSPDRWRSIRYLVFDAPSVPGAFEARLEKAKSLVVRAKNPHVMLVEHKKVRDAKSLQAMLKRVVGAGGEGLMLRKPGSLYEHKRSATLLKLKIFRDAEAKVVGHEPGSGKHKGKLGALVVETVGGKKIRFKLGTGLSDALRKNPPKIGSIVTYRYMDVTEGGVPKGASFVAVRDYE
jgi:DNA ligase-1